MSLEYKHVPRVSECLYRIATAHKSNRVVRAGYESVGPAVYFHGELTVPIFGQLIEHQNTITL